jgi:spermidine/putrescine transport system ATP-binding protein
MTDVLESRQAVDPRSGDGADADVRLAGVSKRFGAVWALRPTDLSVRRGEFFSLLGASGSGKTTTLRVIAGFEEPTSGTLYLQNRDVTGTAPYERNVNTVFQDYALFPHMTVQDNVGYGLRVRRTPKSETMRRITDALALVRLTGFEGRRPSQLSGGQRQRVALARALINRPAVLLLDEPLGALDLKLRREMQFELKRIQTDVGITFIYVTHDQEEAMSMSDRVAVMNNGRIVQIGTPTDIYERPASAFVAGFVGVSNLLVGRVVGSDGSMRKLDIPGCEHIFVEGMSGVPDGGSVSVTIRPEKIQMHRTQGNVQEGTSTAHGRISDVSYAGAFTRYTVMVADNSFAVVEQNEETGSSARVGEEVWLSWSQRQVVVLSGDSE